MSHRTLSSFAALGLAGALALVAPGCGADDSGTTGSEAGEDTGRGGGGGRGDAGGADTGRTDAGGSDVGVGTDAGADAAPADASSDAGAPDATADVGTGDSGAADVGTTDAGDAGACLSQTFEPGSILRPVDIIWAIDASPSMGEEIAIIEDRLDDFALRVGASGLDYRVVLIGSDREQYIPAEAHEYFEICVPPPLSAEPRCPDVDSDRYLHVREPIHSAEALAETIATFPQYRDFLRPDAVKHFVFVTDDDERRAGLAEFEALIEREPVLGDRVHVHSVVDFIGYDPGCPFDEALCSCGDERGEAYLAMSAATDGLTASVCDADWTPLFEALEERVTDAVAVPCAVEVPDPGEGYEVDYREVLVRTTGDDPRDLPRVAGVSDCTDAGGWYFDDDDAPTRLLLCPASCGAEADGLEVELECVTVKA